MLGPKCRGPRVLRTVQPCDVPREGLNLEKVVVRNERAASIRGPCAEFGPWDLAGDPEAKLGVKLLTVSPQQMSDEHGEVCRTRSSRACIVECTEKPESK